jgi:hypothetical protein
MASPRPTTAKTPSTRDDDFAFIQRDQLAEEHRRALPDADAVGPWGRLARLALGEREHRVGCPVVTEGRGRVEADPETVAVAPPRETRAQGIEPGDVVTRVACLECGGETYLKGKRTDALLALRDTVQASGKPTDTVLT